MTQDGHPVTAKEIALAIVEDLGASALARTMDELLDLTGIIDANQIERAELRTEMRRAVLVAREALRNSL